MQDRFRFRAWDVTGRKMLFAQNYIHAFIEDGEPNYTIMQSTGLRDKNDKLIYEGDILQGDEPPHWKAPVIFEEGRYSWYYGENWGEISPESVTIVGNVFENPEIKFGFGPKTDADKLKGEKANV